MFLWFLHSRTSLRISKNTEPLSLYFLSTFSCEEQIYGFVKKNEATLLRKVAGLVFYVF